MGFCKIFQMDLPECSENFLKKIVLERKKIQKDAKYKMQNVKAQWKCKMPGKKCPKKIKKKKFLKKKNLEKKF